MELDVGYTKYSIENSKQIYSFSSLIDYDPASSYLQDAVGEHYYIYEESTHQFFLHYVVRGQRALGAPAFTAAEGIVPIPKDVALLLTNRNRDAIVSLTKVEQEKNSYESTVNELYEWFSNIESKIDEVAKTKEDLKNDLREMLICLNANAFRGCLAMAGVVLERMLKEFLSKRGISFQKDWMVGRLLGAVENSGQYVDSSLKNVWNLINAQRVIGVHAKERVPIPSRDQALMVIFAVKEAVNQILKV